MTTKKKYLAFLDFYLNLENVELDSIKFFRKDLHRLRFWILILKAHFKNEMIIVEDIIKNKSIISKPTALKIIDEAVHRGLLLKQKSGQDKRKIQISPTEKMIDEFKDFFSKF